MSSSGWTPLGLEGLGRVWLGFSPCGIALQKTSLGLVTWWRSIPTCGGVKLKEQAFIEIFVADSFTMVPLAQTNHVAGPGVVGGDYSRAGKKAEEPWESSYYLLQWPGPWRHCHQFCPHSFG